MTLAGTVLAAARDTAAVRALPVSVQHIGQSRYLGQDSRLHFLYGLPLQSQRRQRWHAEAVESFQRSSSP
jgi:hypothetical protein